MMTDEQFRELVRKMRVEQIGFFKSTAGSREKQQHLAMAKKLEYLVDQELKSKNEKQTNLF